ncbi:MAG: hypothetical protein HY211_07135 [Candidatus Omnitrophica bacterium]|nr:hypothetical protein [Candidatus Omnitrophota bacterium]
MSEPESNILALIKLLAEENPEIIEVARTRLVEMGEQAVPLLERAVQEHEDSKVRVEAKGVLERIRLAHLGKEWQKTADLPDEKMDLEFGAFLLAKVSYPDLDPKPYRERLDEIAERVRPGLASAASGHEKLLVLNRVLFKDEGFRGDWSNYFDPQNSYLNRVMDRKLGIPISLAVLYLLIAKRLKIPIQGAGIPGHFMIKYKDAKTEMFIDPFNEGRFLSRPECVQFIVEAGYPYQVDFLEGVGPREILARMLRNLILIYVDRHEQTLEKTLTLFLDRLYPDS